MTESKLTARQSAVRRFVLTAAVFALLQGPHHVPTATGAVHPTQRGFVVPRQRDSLACQWKCAINRDVNYQLVLKCLCDETHPDEVHTTLSDLEEAGRVLRELRDQKQEIGSPPPRWQRGEDSWDAGETFYRNLEGADTTSVNDAEYNMDFERSSNRLMKRDKQPKIKLFRWGK